MFRRLGLVGVLVFNLVMVTFVAAPLVGAASTTVSPSNLNGWATISQRTASSSFVNGPATPPSGVGSLHVQTGAGGSGPDLPSNDAGQGGKTWFTTQQFDGTALSVITALGYSTYVQSSPSSPTILPSLQFQVDLDGDGTYNTAMVFEPYYSTQASGGVQSNVTSQTWQTWNAAAGKWWFTKWPDTTLMPVVKNGHTYCKSDCFNPFTDIQTDFPNAKILTWFNRADGYGTQFQAGMNNIGAPWNDFDGNIDNFSITVSGVNSTFDFEPLMTCYVNASSPPGNDANSGATATAAKKTIQACINITGSGGTVIVAAGTYAENLNVDRPLTIKGPNFGVNANTGSRLAEAVITPASTTDTLVTLRANNVTIDGFTIDGDNLNVSSPVASNQLGANVDAFVGVSNASGVLTNATNVSNNIVKNLGDGVYLSMGGGRGNNGTPSLNNVFASNSFDNMSSRSPNGHAIALEDNVYATITSNVVTRAYMGVYLTNYYQANGGTPAQISGNTIQSYGYGVFYNLHYSNAPAWTVTNNTVTTATYSAITDAPGAATGIRNTGVLLWSLSQSAAATITNNSVSGANYGYRIWNVTSTALPLISGGTLTNNNYGLRYYTCDATFGANSNGAATVTVKDVTINGAVIAGLQVLDDPSAKTAANDFGPACTGITNQATLLAQNVRETGTAGASIGALIDGAKANFGATGSTFQGNGTGVKFIGGAAAAASGLHFNVIVANPTAGLDANGAVGTVDAMNNWWGCNTGPNTTGCDSVSGAGVNPNPWLTLRITRDPAVASTEPGSSFAIVADLVINSNATDTSASGTVQNGTAIAFAVNPTSGGTIAPASGGTTAGRLTATFIAGASGCPVVSATSDDQTVSTSVCINTPPPSPSPSVSPSPSPSVSPSPSPSPSASPSPSPLPSPSTPAVTAYTVNASVAGPGSITPSGASSYNAGTQATYRATATGNVVFVGWTLDNVYVGFPTTLDFVVNGNRTLVATFKVRSTFSDVATTDSDYQAISFLAALGIINPNGVNGSGQFQPDRAVNRAEMAAFIARLFGWEDEFHANNFPDRCMPKDRQNCIDARLWNDVGALKDYGIVGGYTDTTTCVGAGTIAPCYLPRDPVKRVQVLSIIARSFIKTPDLRPTGFWDRLAANGAQYTNVGTEGTQRSDLTTYRTNAGPIPGQVSDATFPDPEGDGSRRFVIEALYQAFAAQFSTDKVP